MAYAVLVIVVIVIFVLAVKYGDSLIEYDIARVERREAEQREAERLAALRKLLGRK